MSDTNGGGTLSEGENEDVRMPMNEINGEGSLRHQASNGVVPETTSPSSHASDHNATLHTYPIAEAVRDEEVSGYEEGIVAGGESPSRDNYSVSLTADPINNTEEDLRRQIRSLEELLHQQIPVQDHIVANETVTAERQDIKMILWVGDKPRSINYEARFLTECGFQVTKCTSISEAQRLLREQNFDVVISDVHRIENGQEIHDAGYQLLGSPEVQGLGVPFIIYIRRLSYLDQGRSEHAFGAADNERDLLNLVLQAAYMDKHLAARE